MEGYDTCTVWMPLVPVKRENALAYVPGSHRLDSVFLSVQLWQSESGWESSVLTRLIFPDVADMVRFRTLTPIRHAFGAVSWDMLPGDCVAFNSRIMHGGSGKLDEDRELRVFTTKWLGDDVRVNFRESGMDPDHSEIMTKYGLKPGDRPGTDLYPEIWTRSPSF